MADKDKRYFWLKLSEEFFKDKPIKKLRRIAGGDTYTVIYLKMLILSLKNDGFLYYDGVENTFEEELALDLEEDEDNVRVTVSFLKEYGYLSEQTPDEFFLTRCGDMVGSETAAAERMRNYRERHKIGEKRNIVTPQLRDSYGSVTTEKEKEKEKEKELELEQEKEKAPKKSAVVYFPNDELLNKAFIDFVQMRKKIKAPMSDKAIELALTKLQKLASVNGVMDNDLAIEIINESVLNSWKSFYPLKQEKKNNRDILAELRNL